MKEAHRVIAREEFFYVLQDNYDEHIELAIPYYREMHEEIVRCIPTRDHPLRILDLGAGTGKTSLILLDNFPGSQLTAVDLFDDMLKHARSRLARFAGHVEYIVGDFMDVPLGTGYDVCVSALAIHHQKAEEKKILFARIFDALAPGGRFLMIDWTRFASPFLQAVAGEIAEHIAEVKVPKAEICRAWCEHWRDKNIPETTEDLCSWLRSAGFAYAECVVRHYGISLICAEKAS